jgi:hypothetical protein
MSMSVERPNEDADLYTREPLRIVFAVTALVLGLVVLLHA